MSTSNKPTPADSLVAIGKAQAGDRSAPASFGVSPQQGRHYEI